MKRGVATLVAVLMAGAAWAYSGEIYTTCRLDPNGDNWLALKSAPDIGSQRIAKLGPGTFLLTWNPEPVGNWRQVTVIENPDDPYETGTISGWVHTGYICQVNYRK